MVKIENIIESELEKLVPASETLKFTDEVKERNLVEFLKRIIKTIHDTAADGHNGCDVIGSNLKGETIDIIKKVLKTKGYNVRTHCEPYSTQYKISISW